MKEASKTEALQYTVQITRYYQSLSGKPATLTLEDWSCIQQWREQGLSVESIRKALDLAYSINSGSLPSLLHCARAVQMVAESVSAGHGNRHAG